MAKYVSVDKLLYFKQKIESLFALKTDVPTKTSQLTNDSGFKTTDNNTTYSLSKSGSTITLTGSDGKTTSVTDDNKIYSVATTSANGLMSSTDKTKLNGIENGAQVNVIEVVKVDGVSLTPSSKSVSIDLSGKVDKVDGKGLSTNDLTNTLKGHYDTAYTHSQSAHAPSNAQANILESVKLNGEALTVNDKAVNIDISGKVDKINGKGLSTNDLTNALKSNYDKAYSHSQSAHAPANAQANVIESIKVNGTAQTVTSKSVNITVPTKVSALTNDSGYQTNSQVQTLINNAISGITGIEFSVVTSLPSTGSKGVIYLVSHSHGAGDSYDEYIWVNNAFEKIGNTDIDLSGYWLKNDLVECANSDIDSMFA